MEAGDTYSEEDLSCPVCYDIYKDPFVLSCGHSFCNECLEVFWRKKERQECPVCKQMNLHTPVCNFALKSLCESHLEEYSQRYSAGSEQLCSIHSEQLKFYCLEDKQPICLICQITQQHMDHEYYPIDEAADHLRVSRRSMYSTYKVIYIIYLSFVFVHMCIFTRKNSKLH